MRNTVTLAIAILSAAGTASARSDFDHFNDYRRALEAQHLDGDQEQAKQETDELVKELDPNSPILNSALKSNRELNGVKEGELDPAEVGYATGRKTEYYCRANGLVYMEGKHNDGSWSTLALLKSQREMIGDSYSQMKYGQWDYELSNS